MFSYNPRIAILMNRLQAGSLYDRDGVILATSKPEMVRKQGKQLAGAGVPDYNLDSAEHKRLDRYYPFEEQMFFGQVMPIPVFSTAAATAILPNTSMPPNYEALNCPPPATMLSPTVTGKTAFWRGA